MDAHDVRAPQARDIQTLKQQAQPLIAAPIAPNVVVQSVQDQAGQCLFIIDDKSASTPQFGAGALLVPLTSNGFQHISGGLRLGHSVDLTWVCKPEDVPQAILVWALIGKNPWYAGKILKFCRAMGRDVHHDIAVLAYAATPGGARIMERIGFKPLRPGAEIYQWDLNFKRGGKHAT